MLEQPSYYALGDHTEAISLDYDPSVIGYGDLLGHFWNSHRCERNNASRQYLHAVFYRNASQKSAAEGSRVAHAERVGIPVSRVATEILPVRHFTYAENYHQKYCLTRFREIRDFLCATYPAGKALADSAVATRLNAYLGSGMGRDWELILSELASYGLPEMIATRLRKLAAGRSGFPINVEGS